jgi:hypothetical protein
MSVEFNEQRSEAIRTGLVEQVASYRAPRRRAWRAVALVAAGVLAGSGAATAAFATGTVRPIVAPTEATPSPQGQDSSKTAMDVRIVAHVDTGNGSTTIDVLENDSGESVTQYTVPLTTVVGPGREQVSEISLADHPAGAAIAMVSLACLGDGPISVSTHKDDSRDSDELQSGCGEDYPRAQIGVSARDGGVVVSGQSLIGMYPLESTDTVFVTTGAGASAQVTIRYLMVG